MIDFGRTRADRLIDQPDKVITSHENSEFIVIDLQWRVFLNLVSGNCSISNIWSHTLSLSACLVLFG